MDNVLRGVGYPTPVVPVGSLPETDCRASGRGGRVGLGRNNTRRAGFEHECG